MKLFTTLAVILAMTLALSTPAQARYYQAETGRYLTADPIGLEGGINPFVYVKNNPVNRVDPKGLDGGVISGTGCICIGIGVMIVCNGVRTMCKSSSKSEPREDECEKLRCQKVWADCREKCSDVLPTPRMDQSNPFFNCVNECLELENCLGKLHKNYWRTIHSD